MPGHCQRTASGLVPTRAGLALAALTLAVVGCSARTPSPTATPVPATADLPTAAPSPTETPSLPDITLRTSLGYGPIREISPSPDGKSIAVGTPLGVARHDDLSPNPRWFHPFEKGIAEAVGWSADGSRIIVVVLDVPAQASLEVESLDALSGDVLSTVSIPGSEASLSPDGSLILVSDGTSKNDLTVFDAATGQRVGALDLVVEPGRMGLIAWSPDGTRIACGSTGGEVSLWNVRAGQLLQSIHEGLQSVIGAVAFSPDGRRLVIESVEYGEGSLPSDIAASSGVWDIDAGRWLWQRPIWLDSPVWSADGLTILARRGFRYLPDTVIVRLDATTGAALAEFPPPGDGALAGAGDALLHVNPDGFQQLDPETLSPRAQSAGYTEMLHERLHYAAFSPDGARVATASYSAVIVWDTRTGQELRRLGADPGPLDWSPDGRRLVVRGWSSGVVSLWDAAAGARLAEIPSGLTDRGILAWYAPDRMFASGITRRVITSLPEGGSQIDEAWGVALLDPVTGEVVDRHDVTRISENAFAADPAGTRFAYTVYDEAVNGGRVIIADGRSGEPLAEIVTEPNSVDCLAWSPDGVYLAGNTLPTLVVWDAGTRQVVFKRGGWDARAQFDAAGLGWLSGDEVMFVSRAGDRAEVWSISSGAKIAAQSLVEGADPGFLRALDAQRGLFLLEDLYGGLRLWARDAGN